MPEVIRVNYKTPPLGQVPPKPRKVKPGDELRFDCDDPTCDFEVVFDNKSALKGDKTRVKRNESVFAGDTPGTYDFICTCNGIPLGGAGQPQGGQLEIGN